MPARKVHAKQIRRPSVDLLGAIGGEMEAEASRSRHSTSTSTQPLGLRCQRREAISACTETRAQNTETGTTPEQKNMKKACSSSGVCEKNSGRRNRIILQLWSRSTCMQQRMPPWTPSSMLQMTSWKAFSVCEKNSGSRFGGPSKLVANFEKGGAGGHPQEDRSPVCMLTIHVGFDQRPTFFSQTPDRYSRVVSV